MNDGRYLNYTRGETLQSVCSKITSALVQRNDVLAWQRWTGLEQRNLRKKQSSLWGVTISDNTYYSFLEQIKHGLVEHASEKFFQSLSKEIREITRTKLYVLFLIQEPSSWPSVESVFKAAQENPNYETALVYTPFYHRDFIEQNDYYDEYVNMGLPVIRHGEYDLPQNSPDVVFMIKPYGNIPEQFQIKHLECVIPRAVYIPYGMEITTDLAKFGFQYYLHYKAWRHCVYGPIAKEYGKRYGYRNGENIVVWGHPKADHYRDMRANREKIPEEWKRFINGRKTILWTPHHLIDLAGNGTGTWLIWGEKILKLAFQTPDVVFIFRPHPLMIGALLHNKAMTQGQFDRMKRKIEAAPNMIWDEHSTYHDGFNAADAIISDGTTFCIEFLYTKKPILLTPRNINGFYLYDRMQSSYYVAHSFEDIENYVDMIKSGEDPLYVKRMELYKDAFFIPENCTVGEYIMTNIKRDLMKECSEFKIENMESETTEIVRDYVPDTSKFPLLSVLVLCYKNTNLLIGMLESIFVQDYPNIQLIVSDDCSEDFDVEKVRSYIEKSKRQNIKNVIVRKNEYNMKTVRHVDKLLSMANGEYIVFTAADDRFVGGDIFSCYIEQFLLNPNAQWIVAKCNLTTPDYMKSVYETPTVEDEPFFENGDAKNLFSRWSRRGMAIPCCMAFRKSAFKLVGGIDLEYQYLEDWPLELKLCRMGHVPIYLNKIVALHSTGGVTNSNERYGKEVRKVFYNDKYLLFQREVEPYKELQTKKDRKCYKQYQREIMDRNYFFNIDYPGTSTWQRMKLIITRPIHFWWVLEQQYMKRKECIHRKKMIILSQFFFLISLLLFRFGDVSSVKPLFDIMAFFDLIIATMLFLCGILTYPLEKYFLYKERLRKRLVN